jgi:hypothetical protein
MHCGRDLRAHFGGSKYNVCRIRKNFSFRKIRSTVRNVIHFHLSHFFAKTLDASRFILKQANNSPEFSGKRMPENVKTGYTILAKHHRHPDFLSQKETLKELAARPV